MTAVHHVIDGPAGMRSLSRRNGDTADTVVLAGSLGSTLAMWEPQVPALSARYRVVRYDARGHGGSPAPPGPYSIDDLTDDVVELLDRLEVERAHFVGLSVGGMVGLRLAAAHPDRVDRLVAACTSAYIEQKDAYLERAELVLAEGPGVAAPTVVGRWFTDAFKESHPDTVARFEAMVAASPRAGYAATCIAIACLDLRPDLARITAPTLVLGGGDDPSIPPVHQEAVAAGIAGSRLEILRPAAHLATYERADEVNALLVEHFEGTRDG